VLQIKLKMSTAAISPETGNRGVGTELRIFLYKQRGRYRVTDIPVQTEGEEQRDGYS
jgi:hypothetical protein